MDTNDNETDASPRSNKSRRPKAAPKKSSARPKRASTARKPRKSLPPDADAGSTAATTEEANPPSSKAPSPKASKQPPKAPKTASQQSSKGNQVNARKFVEDMIYYRLDHWRARGKVVYTNGQRDATSLWSPQWAGAVPSQKRGFNFFDGFDRTWFIPFDIATPLPREKQHIAEDLERRGKEMKEIFEPKRDYLLPRLAYVLGEEIKAKCQDQWDQNWERKDLPPMQWEDVKPKYGITEMVEMVAIGRLADGRALLPGYYTLIVLDLATDGKMLFQRVNMPMDIDFQGFISRLESWAASKSHDDEYLLELVRIKLERIVYHGTAAGMEKAKSLLAQLDKPFFHRDCQGSEMKSWVFKLNHSANYFIRPAQGPANIKQWKELKEAPFEGFTSGVEAGKHPIVVRPWKIRLRRMWPEIDELEEQQPPATGEPELSMEQLEIVDELLAKHTDQERQEGRQFMQALDAARMPLGRFDLTRIVYSEETSFGPGEAGGSAEDGVDE